MVAFLLASLPGLFRLKYYFLCKLRSSCARRNYPVKNWSDNGTNLVRAQTELKKSLHQLEKKQISHYSQCNEINWVFYPPQASHFGGIWGGGGGGYEYVRTIRKVLMSVSSSRDNLTDSVSMSFYYIDKNC